MAEDDFDRPDPRFQIVGDPRQLAEARSVRAVAALEQVVVMPQYLEHPEHHRHCIEVTRRVVVQALQQLDDALEVARFAHVGLVEHAAVDETHDQDPVLVVDQFGRHADREGRVAARDLVAPRNQVDRVVFAETHDEVAGAVAHAEVQVGHAAAQGFDFDRALPARQRRDARLDGFVHAPVILVAERSMIASA